MIEGFVLLVSTLIQRSIAAESVCIHIEAIGILRSIMVNKSLAFHVLHYRGIDLFYSSLVDGKNNGFPE